MCLEMKATTHRHRVSPIVHLLVEDMGVQFSGSLVECVPLGTLVVVLDDSMDLGVARLHQPYLSIHLNGNFRSLVHGVHFAHSVRNGSVLS